MGASDTEPRPLVGCDRALLAEAPIWDEPIWEWLPAAERAYGSALPGLKRRREWFSGRVAAHAVLDRLGAGNAVLLPDADGAPTLTGPNTAGIDLSITHGSRLAVCVGRRMLADDASLGVDLVDDADAPRAVRVLDRHLTPLERRLIGRDASVAALLWGAREAMAKATRTGMFAYALLDVAVEHIDHRAGTLDVSVPGSRLWFSREISGCTLVYAAVSPPTRAEAQERARVRRERSHPTGSDDDSGPGC